jgi:hypothetical protein
MGSWIGRIVIAVGSAFIAAAAIAQSMGWTQLPGAAVDVGVGANGTAWVIGTNPEVGGYGIYRWNPGGGNWDKIPGSASRIAVDPQGNAWVVTSVHAVYHYDGRQFVQVPNGIANDVGIGADGSIWIIGNNKVGPSDFDIYRYLNGKWVMVPGGAVRIAVDPKGNPWVVNSGHQIFHWNGSGWNQIPGGALDVGVGADGSVFIVGTDQSVWKLTGGTSWTRVEGGLTDISVDPYGRPWGVDSGHQIWRSLAGGPPPPPDNTVTILSGDNQQAQPLGIIASPTKVAAFEPLKVSVKDGGVRPLANARVTFTCQNIPPGWCTLETYAPTGRNALDVVTDANGVATLDKMSIEPFTFVAGQKSVAMWDTWGPVTVTAAYGTHTATFHLNVAKDAWVVTVVSGDNQKAARVSPANGILTAVFAPLQVAVKDTAGRGVANVDVKFTCQAPSGMVCQLTGGGAANIAVKTDGNGIATAAQLGGNAASAMAYYADGPITIAVNAGAATTAFHLTVGN